MLERVLVPIDGTEYSWRALEYAAGLAKLSGGSLVIMTVIGDDTPSPIFIHHGDCLVAQIGDEVLDAARAIMQGSGVKCSYVLEKGDNVADLILSAEKSEHCDAIVLGSRGYGMLEGLFKGSISQVIVENADVPVTIIK